VDVGYGPARALLPDQIRQFADFLESLEQANFGADISPEEVAEQEIYFYSRSWEPDYGQTLWAYVLELKQFLIAAIEEDDGVILYLY